MSNEKETSDQKKNKIYKQNEYKKNFEIFPKMFCE